MSNLNGRVAVVTGASSGIGAATAKALAAQGAKVALLARRKDRLDSLAAEIGGEVLALEVDVTSKASLEAAAREIEAKLGPVSIVVNNAGIMLPAPIDDLRQDQWQQQVDLNITGLMNVVGAFAPSLIRSGEKGVADLINISSVAAQNIFPLFAVYSGTKAYVSHFSKTLRAELGAKNVRVSTVEPGIVATELQGHVDHQGVQDWLAGAKEQMDFLEPEDIAQAIAFTVGLPPRVNLQTVAIMPTKQAQ